MSSFRAINQPPDSLLKPTVDQSNSSVMSQQKSSTDRGKNLAQPLTAVLIQHKENTSQSKGKSELEPAVAKARRSSSKPWWKKKKRPLSSPPKPQRQQAPRKEKILYSIEHSPKKTTGSFTSEDCTDEGEDSKFVPPPAHLAETNLSSASSTPSRRSPRNHASKRSNPRMSPQVDRALTAVKQESSLTPAPTMTARPPSPAIWSSPLREKRFEAADFVELPKEVFECQQANREYERANSKYEKMKRAKKELRQRLESKKDAMKAGKAKEKGKSTEERLVDETHGSTKKLKKRKSKNAGERDRSRKRQKSFNSQGPGLEGHSFVVDGTYFSEEPQISNPRNAREDRGTENRKPQQPLRASAEALESQVHERPSDQSGKQTSRDSGQQKRPFYTSVREPCERREVLMPKISQHCSCSRLPHYFTSNPSRVPSLDTWKDDIFQFFKHLQQISICLGSVHPKHVVDACRRILLKHGYPKCWDIDCVKSITQFGLSTNDQNHSKMTRAQSSIAPPDFYGNDGRYRPPANAGSFSRSGPGVEGSRRSSNPNSTSKPVQLPQGARNDLNPSSHLTPPNSSLLGPKRRAGIPSLTHTYDNSACGQENSGATRVSKLLLKDSGRVARSHMSFDTKRQRHKSLPASLLSRDITDDGRQPPPPSPAQRQDDALQEISTNLLNVSRRVASMETMLRRGQVPATAPALVATVGPAPVPNPAPVTAPTGTLTVTPTAQAGSASGSARRKRKKPSHAERQRTHPKLSRHVPIGDRLPDDALIEIGRDIRAYERHRKAPYAFSWSGRLYAPYKHLLARRSGDGVPVWTAEEMKRVTS